jgi:hypothetical protein
MAEKINNGKKRVSMNMASSICREISMKALPNNYAKS